MQISEAQFGMIYGYARVSTAAQDETGQVRQLKAAGCEKIFREKITGTTADRPQLGKLMKKLVPGDVVITPAVDRLSRDTTDLLVIARDMQRAGPVSAHWPSRSSIRRPISPRSSLPSSAWAAKLERRCIFERTARGRADPRKRASDSAAGRRSHPTSRKRPASASQRAKRNAASHGVTMSVKAQFRASVKTPRSRQMIA
jgi:DNA invertase Pin-like site-specific DNA recombinase